MKFKLFGITILEINKDVKQTEISVLSEIENLLKETIIVKAMTDEKEWELEQKKIKDGIPISSEF